MVFNTFLFKMTDYLTRDKDNFLGTVKQWKTFLKSNPK
jgi:hypothetical protein